ncbi:Met-10+ like-protein-domain-containing protein [Mycotypha africana]|uniref:Met-10+ like-protein-domain-containing protein n=1 Tax=Mycotypha africana TaxID=64632 RepID=UPI0023013857|nr:Met-10+ like-protein-domain-containing protein [Mycotypha africana]KAI8982353.1 Met-10+ like-protein-domain-containing protein [Mycotypha africana]
MSLSPPQNKDMRILDRDAFKKTFTTLAVRVSASLVKQITIALNDVLLNQPRLHNVVSDNNAATDTKLILLSLHVKDVKEDLSNEQFLLIKDHDIVSYTFDLSYDYWTTEQILSSVMLEGDAEAPSSYTVTGHIAHVNLKEENAPYKSLIAQVILDKNKKIKSVVNKTSTIDNTYRNFEMEILAGDRNMITELKENECRFKFDFSKVYWNSRLQAEHRRLIGLFKKGDYICDVMAGVGPFAIPAAKKGAYVYANDLNPSSFQWLSENVKLNKISSDNIKTFNLDGRDFIRQAVDDLYIETGHTFNHFIMNLPATAIEFLDTFKGLYRERATTMEPNKLPLIHCYCFTRSSDPTDDITQRINQIIGCPTDANHFKLHWVRTVAPKKDMYCVSFRLTPEIVFS